MTDLVTMTRDGKSAIVRAEWVEEWQGWGWTLPDAAADDAGQTSSLPTRTDIARMAKTEVIEWLEAHGVEAPEGTVSDLRAKLAAIMFVDA